MDYDKRMIETQANLISRLNNQIASTQNKIDYLEKRNDYLESAVRFWGKFLTGVTDNPAVEAQWDHLLLLLHMTADPDYLTVIRQISEKKDL